MVKAVLTCFIVLCVCACTAAPVESPPVIRMEGMVIENRTPMYVSAVRLLVPLTGQFVSCGNIAPESMCSTTFPEANYSGNPVELTWSQGGQIHTTGEFTLELPDDIDENKAAVVRVVISGPGSAGAAIIQRP